MRRSQTALISAGVVLITGCYTPNPGRLASEAHHLVKAGMPLATAEERLHTAHFSCRPSEVGVVTCYRSRAHLLMLSSCFERIALVEGVNLDERIQIVAAVEVPPILCDSI